MMKRLFASVLVSTMTFTTVASQMCFAEKSQPQIEQTKITSGNCGPKGSESGVTWSLDDAGTLTISGTGNMENYEASRVPWYDKKKEIKSVVINDGVTSIGDYAFENCTNLTSVTIPESVTSIGAYAFGITNLTFIIIPNSVTSIGDLAFVSCQRLKYINIPNKVTSIGNYTFESCTSLSSITIPEGVTSIGEAAFMNCNGLTSIIIPNSVTSIGKYAFKNCTSLTSVTIPGSFTSNGNQAFDNCIVNQVFDNCTSIYSITLETGEKLKNDSLIKRMWRSYRDYIKSTPNWLMIFNMLVSMAGFLGSSIASIIAQADVDKYNAEVKNCKKYDKICADLADYNLSKARELLNKSNTWASTCYNLLSGSFITAIKVILFKVFF